MKTIINKLYIYGFVGVISMLCLLFIILPKSTFSSFENRVLQSKLDWSWEALLDKSFSSSVESYIADQFPWREGWFGVKAIAEQARGMSMNNGILLGKEQNLFEAMKEPDWSEVEQYADIINDFNNKFPSMTTSFLLAPTSVELYPQLLPPFASTFSQTDTAQFIDSKLTEDINFLSLIDMLKVHRSEEQPIYYRNDHHWTSYGAYLAYAEYMSSLGIQPISLEQFQITTVSDTFLGSYHTKGQFIGTRPDLIQRYDSGYITSKVEIADDGSVMNELYDEDQLSKKDQYNYYLRGVHALMTVTNELTEEAQAAEHEFEIEELLLIKDSYAHALIPFLSQHVRKLHVIDLRYYNGSIEQYVNEHSIDQTLLLYNIPTFVSERSLINLKY